MLTAAGEGHHVQQQLSSHWQTMQNQNQVICGLSLITSTNIHTHNILSEDGEAQALTKNHVLRCIITNSHMLKLACWQAIAQYRNWPAGTPCLPVAG
jgi:hypothetical protein